MSVVFTNQNIYTQPIPGWDNNPTIGGLASLHLDLGKRYHNIVITSETQPATGLFGEDIIEYISFKINGREQRRMTPAQLHALNRMHSRGGLKNQYDRDDALVLWFEEPWSCTDANKDLFCLGTGNLQICTLELKIKSNLAVAPVLVGYWNYDLALSKTETGLAVPAPIGDIVRIVNYTPELSAGQNHKRNVPVSGLWRAIHIFSEEVEAAEVIVNNESVLKVERNNFKMLQQLFNVDDQPDCVSIWLSRGRETYGIYNSENKNIELVLHCKSDISPQCLIETVGGIL